MTATMDASTQQDRGPVARLIERYRGPRSTARVGKAIGVRQLNRAIQDARSSRTLKWSVAEALANELGAELWEVVAAFAADAGVDLTGLTEAELQAASLVSKQQDPATKAALIDVLWRVVYLHDPKALHGD